MGLSSGFGKKGDRMEFGTLIEVKDNKCPDCGQDLIRLEWVHGPDIIQEGKRCYTAYWILHCCDCSKRFKKLSDVYPYPEDGQSGKGRLREE